MKRRLYNLEENFSLDLVSALDQGRSQKQVNADIKTLEKTINMLQLTATLAKGNSKKEINAYIKTLSDQLSTIKLKAKIDSKNLKSEINSALNKVSFKDIDVLNIDGNKTKLKVQKVIADAKAYAEKNPISIGINYENRRSKLDNDLTSYLNRNTKISESSVLLKEADKVRNLIGAINDKKSLREATDAFQLYKSEVSATGFASKSTADRIKSMFGHITKLGGLFSVTSLAVNNFTKSLGTLKDIDDILTEISKTSDLTAQKLEELGNISFKSASKYGKTASDYLTGIQEMSRSGFYGDKGVAMAEQSLLAQAAGDMSADVANRYILATNAAYKYNGEATKLNAVLDGQNSITNRNSVALSDMATAMSEAGTVASSYRVSVEDLSAMIGTMEAVTKLGGSEVGNGIKAILINLQNVTSSKITDTLDAANASMTEFVNGTEKLRDPISILRDLAETFNKLDEDDALKAEILTNIGGKHQAAKLAALLQNMELFDKMLVDYSEGSGSALEEAMKSANNLSGKLNQLQNSWDSLVNSIVNKNSVLNGLTFGDKLIQGVESFIDTFGEIPVLLTTINTAMAAMKKDYGITQLVNPETKRLDVQGNLMGIDFSAIKEQKNHFSEVKEAIQLWNDAMSNGEDSLKSFSSNIVQNNAQLKTYLSTCSKDAPASLAGYKASLNAAGVSTDTLRLKTILLNSAISMVIGVAIQGIAKALDDYIHRLDNAKEALSSTQSELSSTNSEINDTTAKIAELEALDPSSLSITDKEDLQRLKDQNEELRIRQKYLEDQEKYDLRKVADLTKEKYGQKYGNVNRETVDEYRSLYANKDTKTVPASSYLTGGGTSSQPMPYAASKQNTDAMRGSGTLADLIAQYEYYIELKKEAVQNNDVDGVKQYDDKLSEIAERLRSDRTELQGFSDDLKAAGGTSKELDNITWQLKAIDDLLLSPGQRLANFLDKDILAEDKQKLVDLANAGKLTQNELASDFSEVDKYLKENGLTLDDLISVVKIYKEELADVTVDEIGNLSIAQTIDQLNTQIKPAFDSLKSAWQEIFTDDGFALNSIDILSTCDSIKSKLDEMSEIGLDVDYSAFENLVTVLNDTESTEYDVETAFDALATSITQAGLSGTEDFETMKAALEDLGVVNNEMVAFDNLISKTNALADAGIDLANATEAEMQAFVDESVSAEHAGEALALLQLKKALINQTTITTAADCQNILALAQAANVGIVYLEQLNTLMNLITQRDSAHASGDSRAVSELNRAIRDFSANVVNNLNLDDVKVDFTPIGSGAKSAGSKAGKDYKDALKEQLSDLDSVISGITGRIDDQISSINEQKSAALESIDAQKEALESAKESAVAALEEERQKRLDVIEAQRKQIEQSIKEKQKVVDQINDEIKAIQDANEERKREIDLQKAKYELERMQNQRTKLVNIKCLTL